ncbi:unnamed protein product [Cuscuta campestris]|uniref:Uncharacterized protein n=1 Tax=Cuscuta campestris TaxID=132261 RepID=A0A484L2L9_9ASTE|nr:unnamed protein product [Cuscuta campestris]
MVNSVHPINLVTTMDGVGPSNTPGTSKGRDVADQEEARRRKGKAIAKPSKTIDSALKRLEDKEDGPRKLAKLCLGPEMPRASAFDQLGGGRDRHPTPSRQSRDAETIHLDEDEAESQARQSAYTRIPYEDQEEDFNRIGSMVQKL